MDIHALAEDRGYLVEEVTVRLENGHTRPGWLVLDKASQSFVADAVNWTTAAEVETYLKDVSA